MNRWEYQRTWSLNTFWRRFHFVMCKNCFLIVFLWRWRSKDSVILTFERCKHRDNTSCCRWRSRKCEVLMVLCWKTRWRRCAPWVGGWSHVAVLSAPHEILLPLVFQHKIWLTLHKFLISIYNRSVIPMFTPFKFQDNWIFRFPPSKKYNRKLSCRFLILLIQSWSKLVFSGTVHWLYY